MCRNMVDIQSATAEIRRGIKKEDRRKKPQGKNIMSASATQGGHNKYSNISDNRVIVLFVFAFSFMRKWFSLDTAKTKVSAAAKLLNFRMRLKVYTTHNFVSQMLIQKVGLHYSSALIWSDDRKNRNLSTSKCRGICLINDSIMPVCSVFNKYQGHNGKHLWVQAQDQLLDFCAQVHANVKYIDWYWVEFLCPTRHKMVILETFPKPISLLGTEKIT